MFPSALAISAPIPLALDFTLEFGPVLLVALLAILDLSAVAVLHAALTANRTHASRPNDKPAPISLPSRRPQRAAPPPPRAA